MQKAAADLEAKLSPRRDEIEKLQKELQEIQQKLQGATGGEAIGLQNDGQRKQREAQRKSEGLQADYEFERNEILQRGASKMRNAVAKLAEEKGLDLVVDIGNTLYFKPALDLTKEATAAYNQANAAASQ
jgi:outer membrane protein